MTFGERLGLVRKRKSFRRLMSVNLSALMAMLMADMSVMK